MNGDISPESAYAPEAVAAARDWFVVISGCSGGGKSSLLGELAQRGYDTFAEPGRQIVKEQTFIGGDALPYANDRAFGELCIARTMHRMIEAATVQNYVFFDRGILDALSYFDYAQMTIPPHWRRAAEHFRFNATVFMVPPWPEIFENDAERKHSFENALGQYDALLRIYARFGYATTLIPKAPVRDRANFVLRSLAK